MLLQWWIQIWWSSLCAIIVAGIWWFVMKKDKKKVLPILIFTVLLLLYLYMLAFELSTFRIVPVIIIICILVHIWYSLSFYTPKTIFMKHPLFWMIYMFAYLISTAIHYSITWNKTSKSTTRDNAQSTSYTCKYEKNNTIMYLSSEYLGVETDIAYSAFFLMALLTTEKNQYALETHQLANGILNQQDNSTGFFAPQFGKSFESTDKTSWYPIQGKIALLMLVKKLNASLEFLDNFDSLDERFSKADTMIPEILDAIATNFEPTIVSKVPNSQLIFWINWEAKLYAKYLEITKNKGELIRIELLTQHILNMRDLMAAQVDKLLKEDNDKIALVVAACALEGLASIFEFGVLSDNSDLMSATTKNPMLELIKFLETEQIQQNEEEEEKGQQEITQNTLKTRIKNIWTWFENVMTTSYGRFYAWYNTQQKTSYTVGYSTIRDCLPLRDIATVHIVHMMKDTLKVDDDQQVLKTAENTISAYLTDTKSIGYSEIVDRKDKNLDAIAGVPDYLGNEWQRVDNAGHLASAYCTILKYPTEFF